MDESYKVYDSPVLGVAQWIPGQPDCRVFRTRPESQCAQTGEGSQCCYRSHLTSCQLPRMEELGGNLGAGFCQPETLKENGSASVVPTFDPEPVIAHCFKQFKQNFRLPQSRRRIFIVPAQGRPRQGQAPVDLMPQPPPPPPPVPSFRGLDLGDSPGPLEDRVAWLHQRARLRKELEALDDVARWLENKPSISPLEAKVLRMLHKEREVQIMSQAEVTTATKKGVLWREVPQLRLPKPPALSALYAYLRGRKIQVLELFSKGHGTQQRVSREEFLNALRAVSTLSLAVLHPAVPPSPPWLLGQQRVDPELRLPM